MSRSPETARVLGGTASGQPAGIAIQAGRNGRGMRREAAGWGKQEVASST